MCVFVVTFQMPQVFSYKRPSLSVPDIPYRPRRNSKSHRYGRTCSPQALIDCLTVRSEFICDRHLPHVNLHDLQFCKHDDDTYTFKAGRHFLKYGFLVNRVERYYFVCAVATKNPLRPVRRQPYLSTTYKSKIVKKIIFSTCIIKRTKTVRSSADFL